MSWRPKRKLKNPAADLDGQSEEAALLQRKSGFRCDLRIDFKLEGLSPDPIGLKK
jgi:hypothetical protein